MLNVAAYLPTAVPAATDWPVTESEPVASA